MNAPVPPPWMDDPRCRRIVAALQSADGAPRFVGGAVRDLLLGRPWHEVDLATVLRPETTLRALHAAGLRGVPTGLSHGTVTALADGFAIEITTLRADVETDGRHATVAFATDWAVDAARRDFTVNALSMTPDGQVFDPLGSGMADLQARRLRFIGAAADRIAEDRLRILRFFRFHAELGWDFTDHAGLAAIGAARDGLAALSAERIWREMRRLLAAPDPVPVLAAMQATGVLAVLLPGAADPGVLARLHDPDPLLRLALLAGTADRAAEIARRWKLSGAERDRVTGALVLVEPAIFVDRQAARAAAWRMGIDSFRDRLALAVARGQAVAPTVARVADSWTPPPFPLSGRDATQAGLAPGPAVGEALRAVEDWWIDGDFRAGRPECLDRLRAVIRAMESRGSSPRRD